MSKYYEAVKGFYDKHTWDIPRVRDAVVKGWITAVEYEMITGQEYDA